MPSRRRLIPWIAAGATAVGLAAALWLFVSTGNERSSPLAAVLTTVITFSSAGVGFVLATRRPHNSIGWILLANGFYFALGALLAFYAEYAILGGHDSLPAADWAVAFDDRTWPLAFVGVTAIAFVFPDGRVLEERRRAARLTTAAFGALLGLRGLLPRLLQPAVRGRRQPDPRPSRNCWSIRCSSSGSSDRWAGWCSLRWRCALGCAPRAASSGCR